MSIPGRVVMQQRIIAENFTDKEGNPQGGYAVGAGIDIRWQNGPLGRDESLIEPNGAFVEGVIQAALLRLQYYETTKFKCWQNAGAIAYLQDALGMLEARTADREERGVEGTYVV